MPASSASSVGDISPEPSFSLTPVDDCPYRRSSDPDSQSEDTTDPTPDTDSDDDEYHDCRPPVTRGVTFAAPPPEESTAGGEGLEAVYLNVYDLLGEADGVTGKLAAALGVGLFHCGVEVYGREWSFSGVIFPEDQDPSGIFWTAPKTALPNHSQSLFMGWCGPTHREVRRLLGRMRDEWRRGGYHILTRNCNHFAEALVHLLAGQGTDFPSWVNRVARLGDLLVPDVLVDYFIKKEHRRLREAVEDPEAYHPFPTDHVDDCQTVLSSWTESAFLTERCLSPSPLSLGSIPAAHSPTAAAAAGGI
eukprot:TRINITY_DN238_c0_g1_i2.p1 TRINITY_DN238_c0_g1~~TRINITY_DN238_c0_g1_i2.p1  ORF type:complete len:312 (+),score=84.44 TRINITY_DN238_c0_g1_i2:23-937(+)